MKYAIDINHVPSSKAALTFRVISRAFRGNTVAMNLSTAIKTRLRMDTIADTILKNTPTLQPNFARDPWSTLPLLVIISSVRYNGQVARLDRRSETAMLT